MAKRLSFNEVRNYYITQSCQLLETEYRNNRTPMKYICSCGREDVKVFDKFRLGQRCEECAKDKVRNKLKHDLAHIRNKFQDAGCELLEEKYEHAHKKLTYRCSCDNISKISWNNFQQGQRCPHCRIVKSSKKKKGSLNPAWKIDRRALELSRCFSARCRAMVWRLLRSVGLSKCRRTEELLVIM